MSKFKFTKEDIALLCTAGGMAPSGGNTQPWSVDIDKDTILVSINEQRSGSFLDGAYRASLFSMGCFVYNLKVALDSHGFVYELVDKSSEFKKPQDTLVRFKVLKKNATVKTGLYPYISERVTNRKFYDGTIIDPKEITQLKKQVLQTSSTIRVSTIASNSKKNKAADAIGGADLIRFRHSKLRKQMMEEFRWTDTETQRTRDGIDVKSLEAPPNLVELLKIVRDKPTFVSELPDTVFLNFARNLLTNCSHLCLLHGLSSSPNDWFTAGQSMQALWLLATKLEISIQPWSILPFYWARVINLQGKGFNTTEQSKIKHLIQDLQKSFSVDQGRTPYFIFRLSYAEKPTEVALKIPWQKFTRSNL